MAAVNWAADLVRLLGETGTPREKLAAVRDAMAARWEATAHLEPSDPERHLSADEAVGMLAAKFGPEHGTVRKATQIRDTGSYAPPKPPAHPADLIPPPPADAPPARADTPKPETAGDEAAEPAGPKKAKPKGRKKDAGPEPGVIDVSAEVPTVGPAPYAPPAG